MEAHVISRFGSKQNKYHNVKTTTFDGKTHDSCKEARRWAELNLLQRAGEISDLRRQVRYKLIPAQYETIERYSAKTGKRLKDKQKCIERGVDYIADFVYTDNRTGKEVVEDTKSKATRTPEYIIKKKLTLYLLGISINEV